MSNSPFLIQELHVQTGDKMEIVKGNGEIQKQRNRQSNRLLTNINSPARELNQALNK